MALEISWVVLDPLSSHKAGLGASEIQEVKRAVHERLSVNHNMDNVLSAGASQDGTHKYVTLKEQTTEPTTVTGAGLLYTHTETNDDDGEDYLELIYKNEEGVKVQLTAGGALPFANIARYMEYGITATVNVTDEWADIVFDDLVEEENIISETTSHYDDETGIFTAPEGAWWFVTLSFSGTGYVYFQLLATVSGVLTAIYTTARYVASSSDIISLPIWLDSGNQMKWQAKMDNDLTGTLTTSGTSLEIIKL